MLTVEFQSSELTHLDYVDGGVPVVGADPLVDDDAVVVESQCGDLGEPVIASAVPSRVKDGPATEH